MMTLWLLDEVEDTLPPGPSHFIGVGGFVLRYVGNEKTQAEDHDFNNYEVLVIKEKHGPSAKLKDFWKLPGGLVDRMEDIASAATREVAEETGIETVFDKVCCIQEIHNGSHSMTRKNTTDLYTICALKLKDPTKTDIQIQEAEISDAKWLNLHQFLNSSVYKNRRTVFHKMIKAAAEVGVGLRPGIEHAVGNFGRTKQSIYLAAKL